jgi:hypothetical protein
MKKKEDKVEKQKKANSKRKKEIRDRLKQEKIGRKESKLKEKKWRRFFKLTKVKLITLATIIVIAFVFQWLFSPDKCLAILCKPYVLGVLYYVFWIFDLLAIGALGWLPPNPIVLFITRAIALVLQAAYWYIATCYLSIPINKLRGKIGIRKRKKKKQIEKRIEIGIARDLRKANELEREKIKKEANKF